MLDTQRTLLGRPILINGYLMPSLKSQPINTASRA